MKKFFLVFVSVLSMVILKSQTVTNFSNFTLGTDTFWDGSDWSGGFSSGEAYFVNAYDTGGGYAYWSGFVYSNMHGDTSATVDTPFTNALQYSSVTGAAYAGSGIYAVAYDAGNTKVYLTGNAAGRVASGFYTTNNVYAFLSMKYGDEFEPAFTYSNRDTFVLKVTGWNAGHAIADTVSFYLADFRDSTVSPGIITNWQWVDLHKLGNVDSLIFSLVTSQNGQFGGNTPAYFCLDNFTTSDTADNATAIQDITPYSVESSVYPNPFSNSFQLSYTGNLEQVRLYDLQGKLVKVIAGGPAAATIQISASDLSSGTYICKDYYRPGNIGNKDY